jgi:hypothetical protein
MLQNAPLAQRYGVGGYPTIKVFIGSKVSDYQVSPTYLARPVLAYPVQ